MKYCGAPGHVDSRQRGDRPSPPRAALSTAHLGGRRAIQPCLSCKLAELGALKPGAGACEDSRQALATHQLPVSTTYYYSIAQGPARPGIYLKLHMQCPTHQ